jgi:hypothetical protein
MGHRQPRRNPIIINIDEYSENTDAPKRTWQLPPYKSPAFMRFLVRSGSTLHHFKSLPVYRFAVMNGLINPVTDEWQGPQSDVVAGGA